MKFLSSSSSSASTTTTTSTSFDGNSRSPAAGCIAGVFRWLLCFNNLPRYPSKQFKDAEIKSTECEKLQSTTAEDKVEASATPGIVARLMGLKSMPETDLPSTKTSSSSIARSRPMNSVDLLRDVVSIQVRHRRVQSFREAPTFIALEDEHFFILSFENGGETKDFRSKTRKLEMGSGVLKQRRADKCKKKSSRRVSDFEYNKENQEISKASNGKTNRVVSHKSPQRLGTHGKLKDASSIIHHTSSQQVINDAQVSNSSNNLHHAKNFQENSNVVMEVVNTPRNTSKKSGARTRKKKDNCLPVDKAETEFDLENSSPVSVLDSCELVSDPKVPLSEEDSRLTNSNSRRKLSEELECHRHTFPDNDSALISKDREANSTEDKCFRSRKKGNHNRNYVETLGQAWKLTETDMMQCSWIYKEMQRLEDFEDISTDFGLEILDQLLVELVDQLVGDPDEQC